MTDRFIDFRSDTVTRPTPAMRAAMAAAEVGDDVLGDDPTVQRLERRIAELLGQEAALFVPSGTMSNQIGVRLHCRPGDEMICEAGCHVYNHEQAAYAQLSGVAAGPSKGIAGRSASSSSKTSSGPTTSTTPAPGCLRSKTPTTAAAGGSSPTKRSRPLCGWAREHGLRTHLDGARLLNAAVATGIEPPRWARHFDTVSVCFSKGSARRSARRLRVRAT